MSDNASSLFIKKSFAKAPQRLNLAARDRTSPGNMASKSSPSSSSQHHSAPAIASDSSVSPRKAQLNESKRSIGSVSMTAALKYIFFVIAGIWLGAFVAQSLHQHHQQSTERGSTSALEHAKLRFTRGEMAG
jgi:hypothetical protein